MASVETGLLLPPQSEKEPMRISRAVFVSPAPLNELKTQIIEAKRNNTNIADLSFLQVLLIQKSKASKASADMVMGPGGEAAPNESDADAVFREGAEETGSTALHPNTTREEWEQNPVKSITFKIPGYDQKRSVSIRVLPVSVFAHNTPREKQSDERSEDKIAKMPSFTPKEFKQLLTEGSIQKGNETFPAAGHFTLADVSHDMIEMTSEQRANQREALETTMQQVDDFDTRLKRETLREISRVRILKRGRSVKTFDECSVDEIATGFIAAQMRMALEDDRKSEKLDQPNARKSLLKVLPYLTSELSPEGLSDLLLSLPTKETILSARELEGGFREGVEKLIEEIPNDKLPNKRELFDSLVHEGASVSVLRSIWPTFMSLADVDRIKYLKVANKAAVRGLADTLGVDERSIKDAVRAADQFHDFITEDLRGKGKDGKDTFQEFRPLNEITNAKLFTMMIFALGMHPNRAEQSSLESNEARILRFEALRHLSLVMTGVEVVEKSRHADISLFEAALDTFFEPPTKEALQLGNERSLNVYHRMTKETIEGRKIHVIIDERPKKRIESGIRKRMQDPHINDIHSINIVVTADNFSPHSNTVEEQLQVAQSLRDQLLEHAWDRVGGRDSGWKIEVLDHRTKSVQEVRELEEQRMQTDIMNMEHDISGKRPGSKGDAIIRDKFILRYESPSGKEQSLEVNIYPIESTKSEELSWLAHAGKWGFVEKVNDDAQGGYNIRRLTARSGKSPMEPTLLELLYSNIYKQLSHKTSDLVSRKTKVAEYNAQQ